ncbi:MAG: hypothetical protein PHU91_04960 [Candidatus Omnitrophica bacterium]|nr:hypothetical protein [Candidatus Omnitrophota bacterium]MDD5236993.1 hypothetical protein [Candidatus Omnitrophota bacterium]MDD5609974.1 hypothetical protein [Candidatus Omnitrophota bacterium]
MMAYIQRYLKVSISVFLFSILINNSQALSYGLIADALAAKGQWVKGVVADRKAVIARESGAISEIEIQVPRQGRYNLLVYVYHNWKKFSPCIYVEAVDSEGKKHFGSHRIENCWYLKEPGQGRWFMVSLSDNPWWVLPKGNLTIRFWAKGCALDAGKGTEVPMEGDIAIERFFLVPVVDELAVSIINPESTSGGWGFSYYDKNYQTGYIFTDKKNSLNSYAIKVPFSGYYQVYLSLLSLDPSALDIGISNGRIAKNARVVVKPEKEWGLVVTEPLFLNKGEYTLSLKNVEAKRVLLDYLLLLPFIEKNSIK